MEVPPRCEVVHAPACPDPSATRVYSHVTTCLEFISIFAATLRMLRFGSHIERAIPRSQ